MNNTIKDIDTKVRIKESYHITSSLPCPECGRRNPFIYDKQSLNIKASFLYYMIRYFILPVVFAFSMGFSIVFFLILFSSDLSEAADNGSSLIGVLMWIFAIITLIIFYIKVANGKFFSIGAGKSIIPIDINIDEKDSRKYKIASIPNRNEQQVGTLIANITCPSCGYEIKNAYYKLQWNLSEHEHRE